MAPLSASSSEEEQKQRGEQRRKKFQEEEVEEDGEEEANDDEEEEEEEEEEEYEDDEEEEEVERDEPVAPATKLQTLRSSTGEEEEPDSDDDGTQRRALNARKKRQNDAPEATKHYKRIKTGILKGTMKSPEDSSSKKPLFQRIWSEDDEIVILKGLTRFIKTGGDPFTDSIGFHGSIKKSLHFDASPSQLKLKVRKLKQKFESKKTKIDENPASAKSHDLELHELSRNIWGGEESKRDVKTRSTGGKKDSLRLESSRNLPAETNGGNILNDLLERESSRMLTAIRGGLTMEGMCLVGCSMSDELKLKWKKLLISENELYLKQVELGKERAQLMLETLNASD